MSKLARYAAYTPEAAEEDARRSKELAGDGKRMEFQPGENIARILPVKLGTKMANGQLRKSPLRLSSKHYIKGLPGMDPKAILVFACPRVELNQPCVACVESERLGASTNPMERERAYDISAKLFGLANVIDRGQQMFMPDGEINLSCLKYIEFGVKVNRGLKAIMDGKRLGGDYSNPTESGFDVCITKIVTKDNTDYAVNRVPEFSPVCEDEDVTVQLIEAQFDLEQFIDPVVPERLLEIWGDVRSATVGGRPGVTRPSTNSAPRAGSSVMKQPNALRQHQPSAVTPPRSQEDIVSEALNGDDFAPEPSKQQPIDPDFG